MWSESQGFARSMMCFGEDVQSQQGSSTEGEKGAQWFGTFLARFPINIWGKPTQKVTNSIGVIVGHYNWP